MKSFKRFFRNTAFRQQLVLAVTAGVLCIALLSSLASSWQGSRQIRDTLIKQGERVADNLAHQSKLALIYDSPENAADAVNLTLAFPDVRLVEIIRKDGRSLIVKGKAATIEPLMTPDKKDAQHQRAFLEAETSDAWRFVAPVFTEQTDSPFEMQRHSEELLGYVRVVQSKSTLQYMMRDVFVVNLTTSFFFAFVFLFIIHMLTTRLIRPITHLSEAMAKAEAGAKSVRAELSGPKDIVHMAQAFNSMMSVLEEREQELRKARDDAVKFARLKAEFAATVSHEIRTPLNGVLGTLDILMASTLPARQRQFVEIAWESAQYLLDLINNILDFSKLEAGKLQLEKSEFDIRRLMERIIDLLAPQAHQKGLEMGYLISADVPPNAKGDVRGIRQVLTNLIGNAVKFTSTGEIALRVSVEGYTEQQWTLRFEVADTGIGIPEESRERVFDSFTQLDNTPTRRHGGSGLGLAICKQLVNLMGGKIGVDSELDKGSKFWFTVPLDVAAPVLELPPQRRIGGRNSKVLLVEESAVVRHFIEQSLERQDFICRAAQNADEAIRMLRDASNNDSPYYAVILDTGFATLGGGDLLTRVRGDTALRNIRLIVMNRSGTESTTEPSQQALANAYLAKPLRLEQLLQSLSETTSETTKETTTTAPNPAKENARNAPNVLVVEDNRTNQTIAQGMLSMLGCNAEITENGHDALRAFKRQAWDLILMDCNMPEMDGYQVTAAIRAIEADTGKRTTIVAMTANAQLSDVDKCLSAGMDDHLAKPLTLSSVAAKLKRWISSQSIQLPDETWVHADSNSHSIYDKNASEPLDANTISKLREALGEAIGQAIRPFLEDMPTYLEEMEQASILGDAERLRNAVHAVKGASGNLGAIALAAVAKEIEDKAASEEITGVQESLARLRAEYALVKQALLKELKTEPVRQPESVTEGALVLVVDDDRSTRSALRYALQSNGFRVDEASDGAQALALLDRISPDIILMDAIMPVMDGFTACAKLQEMNNGKHIPVLMITALDDNQSIERAFAAGASDYIHKPIHLAVVNQRVRRVVEATRAERHVRHLAYNDTLTGLPNRVLFNDYLSRAITRASNHNQSLAILFLDLDRFKFVNDTLGHEIGDRLLQSAARRIKHCVRSGDCVARLGGDEFTIILDDVPDASIATLASQKIGRALAAPFEIDGHDIFVSASIGISLYPNDGADVSTLLRHADTAMYRAKKKNSGCEFYEAGMEASVSEHLRMESALRRGLERKEFIVYYQPITDTASGRLTGAEALIRWRTPSRGMVSPADFIPLAEETGMIIDIGEWVLRTACHQAKAWVSSGISDIEISVNISGKQLQQDHFVDVVRNVLAETRLNPKHLSLEITESVIMGHARDTVAVLNQLKEIGVNLVIDDFGTGYSSLSYLKRFPVDILKIDRSFTRDMTTNQDDAAIVTAIIALAHSLRLKVVAEGVETKAQLDLLARKDCDFIQGYYLSEPIPVDLFEERILATHFPHSK